MAAMPPPSKPRRRRSTPIIGLLFWIIVIALAVAGFVYGKRIWPSLFEDRQPKQDSGSYVSVTCDVCSGHRRCPTCRGSGRAESLQDNRKKQSLGQINCRACKGSGKCRKCDGAGTVQQKIK